MTTTAPPAAPDPAGPLPRKPWWHRSIRPEDRRRVLNDLAIVGKPHWAYRFTVMITLSVVIAVMGLWLDSAAVVIGAMLVAPLMQPVLATGACLSMALFSKGLWSFTKVMAATLWCVFVAYVLSRFLPNDELTTEILARTRPDIKDLFVALAAGTAGAYATVREDASSSLPGVAVAVALVPPLATVGIALEAGEPTRATGAALLYGTNLAAIILVSMFVFMATGFAPTRRLVSNGMRMVVAVFVVGAAVVLLSARLYDTFRQSIDQNERQDLAEALVDDWLNGSTLNRSVTLDATSGGDGDDGTVDYITVALRGSQTPPDQGELVGLLAPEFPEAQVFVEWIRTHQATTTTTAPKGLDQLKLEEVTATVEAWLASDGIDYQIDRVTIDEATVRIDAAGTGDPPPIAELAEALGAVDENLVPRLNWVELETITPGDDIPTPIELDRAALVTVTEAWAEANGYVVQGFVYDGERVVVEVAGAVEPTEVRLSLLEDRLVDALTDDEGGGDPVDLAVELFYTPRRQVTTTTAPDSTDAQGPAATAALTTTTSG